MPICPSDTSNASRRVAKSNEAPAGNNADFIGPFRYSAQAALTTISQVSSRKEVFRKIVEFSRTGSFNMTRRAIEVVEALKTQKV